MKYVFLLLFYGLILLFTTSCKKKPTAIKESSKKEVVISKFAKNYPDFNPQKLRELLQADLQSDSILDPFYTTIKYTPIWVHDTLDTKNLNMLIDILDNVDEHGLSSELFSLSRIKTIAESIDSGVYSNSLDTLYIKMSILERISTSAIIKYASGMQFGFLRPADLYGKDYDITVGIADSIFFVDLYNSIKQNPIQSLLDSQPKDSIYIRLQKEYKSLEKMKEADLKPIASGNATYKLGDKNKHIAEIAQRLVQTGEYVPDSLTDDSLYRQLDDHLLAAVNTFRKRMSYPEENEVGKLTIEALNRPVSYYLDRVKANMERYRWKRVKSKHNKHLEVNVASAMLVATQTDSLPLLMRVCVGSVNNKTPLLQSDIGYLNLNPIWNVPKSIAQKEVAILQKRDTTYIRRHNMRLYKGGKEVDVASINWKEVNPSQFNYLIKQDAGNSNSLGLIKFMFNNAFSVYLHDTPSKATFNRKNRAVSHGCVRVQRPFDLAFFCTSPSTELYKDQLLYSVNKSPVTKEGKQLLKEDRLRKLPDIINLKADNKISLFIDYYTIFMYPNDDMLYYADDVYGYDNVILEALKPNNQ
ncbi:MAG: L,D-transpeptidase family protein [Dysgonomonas sp.]